MIAYRTRSPQETFEVGKRFAAQLKPGDCVFLTGTLGSGKTLFASGICEGLGVRMHATSPTFTFINEYSAPFGKVIHIDLYRIERPSEVDELGMEEYFTDQCVCLIEWPEKAAGRVPPRYYEVRFRHGDGENEREIAIEDVVPA
ncbi:MAG: tRNA (adenosine(37)-N6)-threonylcarbamoyltransferase complex ATPase subunit type 1 TsaE [Ignavibacteria bacterium]